MFKPHVTVACIVKSQGQFLIVEETVNGKVTWNQPAGHLEANETLFAAAKRELYEETGIHAEPQSFLKLHQWQAPDGTPFLRFAFVIELDEQPPTAPQDSDIDRCIWVSADDILNSTQLRSPLVAESIRCFQQGSRFPLDLLANFNLPE